MHAHTWQKAAAIPTTLALAVGGVLLVVPTATAAAPVDASVSEEALVTDQTPAPVVEVPAEAPGEDVPVVEAPVAPEPAGDETAVVEPVADESAAVESVADEPAAVEPAVDEPVAVEPVADQPTAVEPVAADEPTAAAAAIPTAPVLTSPASGSVVRSAARGEGDFRAPVTFTGTGQPGAVVKVRIDPVRAASSSTRYAVAPVGADGGWTATVELGDIEWITTVRQYARGVDGQPAGDPSPEVRAPFQHVVAYQAAPAPVTIVPPTAGGLYEPTSASGATRLGGPVTIVVRGIPGAKVEMSWRDATGSQRGPSGDITVPASGVLTHVATIPTGEWRFSARQYLADDTGRRISSRSVVSGGRDFTVRPATLPVPTVTSVADGGVLVAAGQYPQDAVFGPRPAVTEELVGTGTPGATIEIVATDPAREFPNRLLADVAADGTWRVVPYLEPGENVLTVRQVQRPTTSPSGFSGVNAGSATITVDLSVVLPGARPEAAPASLDGTSRPGSVVVGTGATAPTPGAVDGSLAYTGAETAEQAGLLGALMVALGLGAVVLSRRRRTGRGSGI